LVARNRIGRCRSLPTLQFHDETCVIKRKALRIDARLELNQLLGGITPKVDKPITGSSRNFGAVIHNSLFVVPKARRRNAPLFEASNSIVRVPGMITAV
jgi:hypothetical protein